MAQDSSSAAAPALAKSIPTTNSNPHTNAITDVRLLSTGHLAF
jgi:hypothetical protein